MEDDWKIIEFGKLIEGKPRHGLYKPEEFYGRGAQMIKMGTQSNNSFINDACIPDLIEVTDKELHRFQTIENDLLFLRTSLVFEGTGKCSIVKHLTKPTVFVSNLIAVSLDTKLAAPYFYFYYFSSVIGRQNILSMCEQTAASTIRSSDLSRIIVPYPPLPEQRAIAHILGTLDDKIELNRKTNETLEAMARALFKSWFVDFEPVRAKAEGRPTGLPEEIDKLFPDSFEESELGEVPRGWSVAPLPNLVDVNPTRQLSKGQIAPYLEMANVQTRGHRPLNWIMRPYGSGMKFMNGDTLMARITPCLEHGKTVYVDFLKPDEIGWGSTEFIVLRPKLHVPTSFGYYLARSENFRDYSISNMMGTSGRQRVPADCFGQYLLPAPPKAIFDNFGTLSTSILEAIKWNDMQSRTLASIRDALLPKLISGEVRITDVEGFVGDRGIET